MELGLNRRNIGRLVLLAWAVMLAWLARREFTRGEDSARSQQIARLAPAAQYFAVYAAGRQVDVSPPPRDNSTMQRRCCGSRHTIAPDTQFSFSSAESRS